MDGHNCTGNLCTTLCITVHYLAMLIPTDINECLIDNGGCVYTCTNTPGSFTCDCSTGYNYDPIEMNCTGEYLTNIPSINYCVRC